MYKLIELFNTLQGEGSTQGLPVTLIRTQKCNLVEANTPCRFCDTLLTMSKQPIQYTINDIIKLSNVSRNLLITGGEPTMYIPDIIDILYKLYTIDEAKVPNKVIFETNGYQLPMLIKTIHNTDPLKRISKYVYSWSPKIWSDSLMNTELELLEHLAYFDDVEIKLVIDPKNYGREQHFINRALASGFDKWRIWLMPLGAKYEELMSNLYPVIQLCHQLGVNLSPRLHIVFGKNLDKELNPQEEIV